MEDSFLHQGLRRKLVEQVRSKGIRDEAVLAALMRVPRHLFMDSGFLKFAYADKAFPIASGQTISQPYTVAFQTELLEVGEHHKILEVGTGSGYQAAVLAELGARVYTVERIRGLSQSAQVLLNGMGYTVKFFVADGNQGLPAFAPYDRILVTAGAREFPDRLKYQLSAGGILVTPVGPPDCQTMMRCIRTGEDTFEMTTHGSFVFVPLRDGVKG